jgi:hypothetical protein
MSRNSRPWSIKLAEKRASAIPTSEYLVLVVKNSTAYSPGTWLTREQVDSLCSHEYWDVTIVSYDENQRRRANIN